MRLINRILRRLDLRREDGFTMLLAIVSLALVTAVTVAAYAAVNGDLPLQANDSLQKQAYAAAQAGIQQYLFELDQNNQYWTQCVPSPPNGVNLAGSTANTKLVPGSTTASYAIELMPAAGQSTYTQCSTSDPAGSMIQASGSGAGSLRIRSTGIVGGVRRTIVAQLRESTFLDYVWFTQYETDDPSVQLIANGCSPSSCPNSSWSSSLATATSQCSKYYRNGRDNTAIYNPGGRSGSVYCDILSFITGDDLQGPVYTDDEFAICGSPVFGRSGDPIYIGAAAPGQSTQGQGGCADSFTDNGPVTNNAPIMSPPSTDAALQTAAQKNGLVFTGVTCINFSTASSILVAQPASGYSCANTPASSWKSYSYPSNGVIYVQNSSSNPCTISYDYTNPDYNVDSTTSGCGIAYVSGNYYSSVTVGTANDIVITGSLNHNGPNTLMGLVANGFVRVYHPCTSNTNGSGSISSPQIDAAILSVQHSLIVDNFNCGAPLGTLNVFGSIGQEFRGGVGTHSGGTVVTGYNKGYVYDDRLRYEEPPDFLNPVSAAWHVMRENECTATAGNSC